MNRLRFLIVVATAAAGAAFASAIDREDGADGAVLKRPRAYFEMVPEADVGAAEAEVRELPVEGEEGEAIRLVKGAVMTEKQVEGATAFLDAGGWRIELSFDHEGGEIFGDITKELAASGRRLAMLVNGRVLTAPVVRERIEGGKALISGDFTREEATAIAEGITKAAGK